MQIYGEERGNGMEVAKKSRALQLTRPVEALPSLLGKEVDVAGAR